MRRITKLGLVALAGAAVGAVLARFRRPAEAPVAPADDRAGELRRKLAEARAAAADQDDFAAAGMGAETIVEEPLQPEPEAKPKPTAVPEPKAEPEPEADAPAPPEEPAAPPPAPTAGTGEAPPQDEFEAMRRRIHEEGRAAAEEMRRSAESNKPDEPDKPDKPDKP